MGKRKRSSKDDDSDIVESLLKKVKKLVRKRRKLSSSDDENEVENFVPSPQFGSASDLVQTEEIPIVETPLEVEVVNSSEELDPDILELLGTDPSEDKSFGENLQKDLAVRWNHILINGLPKNEKADLMKQYLPAENCSQMRAPKLNPEVKSALGEMSSKKDSYSEQKQNQLSSCIAAIGKALNQALSHKDVIPQDLIKTLGDAGRLLCDTHYRESMSRRFAVINSISKQKRDVIKNTKVDGFLFGTDLSEHLKSSNAISKSAAELKTYASNSKYNQLSTSAYRSTLNARGAPRAQAAVPRANPVPPRRQPPPPLPPPPPPPPSAPRDRRREPANLRPNNYRQQYQRR